MPEMMAVHEAAEELIPPAQIVNLDDLRALGYNDIYDSVCKEIEMRTRVRNEILSKHKFAITPKTEHRKGGDITRYRTFLPDKDGKKGKEVVKSTEREVQDAIVEFYKAQIDISKYTLGDVYQEWSEYYHRLHNSSENTKLKYWTDYNRFFKNHPITNRRIAEITDNEIEDFFLDCITSYVTNNGEHGLTYKAFGRLYGYMSGVFQRAYKLKIIASNPMLYLEKRDFINACRTAEEKTAETELVSDKHFDLILTQLYEDMKENPTYFATYAVELAALTGMRVAELATLKWEDINYDEGVIIISRSDKNKRILDENGNITHQWVVEKTKTKKKRKFPIDEYIARSLRRIRKIQMQHGMASEWLFPHNEYGWTHSSIISSCLKNKCLQLKLGRTYGIHAFRKTLNSDMRMDNAPAKMCASMLGNTVEVNDSYYFYDTSDMSEKTGYARRAHEKRAFA